MIGQSICSIFTSAFLNEKLNVFMKDSRDELDHAGTVMDNWKGVGIVLMNDEPGMGSGSGKIVAKWSGEGDDAMEASHAAWLGKTGVTVRRS